MTLNLYGFLFGDIRFEFHFHVQVQIFISFEIHEPGTYKIGMYHVVLFIHGCIQNKLK